MHRNNIMELLPEVSQQKEFALKTRVHMPHPLIFSQRPPKSKTVYILVDCD